MKRLLPTVCFGLLFLASCAKKSTIPSDEVLRRAVSASGQLQSASFNVQADLKLSLPGMKGAGVLTLKGVLQDGGNATQFALGLNGSMTQGTEEFTGTAQADIASDRDREVYFRIGQLALMPSHPLLNEQMVSQLLNRWWKIPQKNNGSVVPVSPDPTLLRAQSEVVRVTRDRGIVDLDGREAFHYDVSIDPEKMAAFLQRIAEEKNRPLEKESVLQDLESYDAKGELWIDAESFNMRKIQWTVRPKSGKTTPYALTIDAVLSDHNVAKPIEFPLSAEPWIGMPLGGSALSSGSTIRSSVPSASSARPR